MHDTMEKHHILKPVSFGGMTIEPNLALLKESVHDNLHKTLKMPHSKVRSYRERANGKWFRSAEHCDREFELQKLFFKNIHDLPEDVQATHWVKSKEMINWDIQKQQHYAYHLQIELPELILPYEHTDNREEELFNVLTADKALLHTYWEASKVKAYQNVLQKI